MPGMNLLSLMCISSHLFRWCSQFYNKAKEELPDLETQLSQGQFGPIKVLQQYSYRRTVIRVADLPILQAWLGEKVHRRGALLPSGDELCRAVTGEALNPSHFIKYLRAKYSELYRLE